MEGEARKQVWRATRRWNRRNGDVGVHLEESCQSELTIYMAPFFWRANVLRFVGRLKCIIQVSTTYSTVLNIYKILYLL